MTVGAELPHSLPHSLWSDQLPPDLPERARLEADVDVDVAVVGAGYTGLWTAHSLLVADPSLRVLVVEAERVGFGASGRNGGWCVGELAGGLAGAGPALARAAMDTVAEVGRVVADEGIDCGFVQGGVIRLARTGAQLARQAAEVEEYRAHGFGPDDLVALDAAEASARLRATEVRGGLHVAHAARIHPARLVHGLAAAVERRGGRIVEQTQALEIHAGPPAMVLTGHGRVRADVVVRATEAYTRDLDGHRRTLLPFYSLMVATEPLPAALWDEIGLAQCETFADDRHMVIYGQRTPDDRIAFGGRGAPYLFGSRIDPAVEQRSRVHTEIAETLVELLPQLRGVEITHRWGGVLGIPRDWRPSVGLDRSTGLAWAGGYVGEGVAAANLAGRTLADLITGTDSDLTTLPWVNHHWRRWEPEPLRWLAVNGMLRVTDLTDRLEARSDRPSRLGKVLGRLRNQ